jgi:hypothetical protein
MSGSICGAAVSPPVKGVGNNSYSCLHNDRAFAGHRSGAYGLVTHRDSVNSYRRFFLG